jgi:hypothetical protein
MQHWPAVPRANAFRLVGFLPTDQQPLPGVALTDPVVDGVLLVPDVGLLPMPVVLLVPVTPVPVVAVPHGRLLSPLFILPCVPGVAPGVAVFGVLVPGVLGLIAPPGVDVPVPAPLVPAAPEPPAAPPPAPPPPPPPAACAAMPMLETARMVARKVARMSDDRM